ncbi:MAG: TetR/AcrR family transcriptional regulator [Candidatus Limnocylindrales bacterium]
MPRVTVAHEQAVRQRIVDAAIGVFGELGYQRATVQDVVRASGLSVGAVYTHFRNKEELFLVACACEVESQKADLRLRMAELGSVTDRLRAAIDFAVDSAAAGGTENSVRAHAWMVAGESADLRQILRDRRTEMVAFSRLVLQEALVRGELPSWIDADAIASAFVTLIDGFVVRAVEAGSLSVDDARREAYALLELLLAAPHEMPAPVEGLRSRAGARPA